MRKFSTEPHHVARRHRWYKRFWAANIPFAVSLYLFAGSKVMGLYIAVLSVQALYITEAGVEQAAEARLAPDDQ